MGKIIHYIGKEWDSIFIIAKTSCGKSWDEVNESTDDKKEVTCKKCLKKISQ